MSRSEKLENQFSRVGAESFLASLHNPGDDLAKDVRAKLTAEPERYAAYTREYLGWGVFALMPR